MRQVLGCLVGLLVVGGGVGADEGVQVNGSVVSDARDAMTISSAAHRIAARDGDGHVVWWVDYRDAAPPRWRFGDDGLIHLEDGFVVDLQGNAVAYEPGGDDGPNVRYSRSGTCPMWSDARQISTPIGGESDVFCAPVFDSTGNAWAFYAQQDGPWSVLRVRRSYGHDGYWTSSTPIAVRLHEVSRLRAVIDADDNITLLFREIAGDEYWLVALRYEPETGWGEPLRILSTPTPFQTITAGVNFEDHVIVVVDQDGSLVTVVFNSYSGTWDAPVEVGHYQSAELAIPTVVVSQEDRYVTYLIYAADDQDDDRDGLYVQLFDSSERDWYSPEYVAGTESLRYGPVFSNAAFPAAFSTADDLIVFWEGWVGGARIYGSRADNGEWQPPVELASSGYGALIELFGTAAASETGDVWCAATLGIDGENILETCRYRAGVG